MTIEKSKQTKVDHFTKAEEFKKQNNLAEAIDEYRQAINSNPEDASIYRNLGDLLYQQNCIDEAVNAFQKAIDLNAKQPFHVYKHVGDAYMKQGKINEAISAYQTVLDLKQDVNPRFKVTLADLFKSLKQWEPATYYLKSALDMNPYLDEEIYANLIHAQLKLGHELEARKTYQSSLNKHYLINHKHKIVYCPIPKNANMLFKTMMIEHSDEKTKYEQLNERFKKYTDLSVDLYIRRDDTELRLKNLSYLNDSNYFKFVILRNPFNRLVSAYLDKIVGPNVTVGIAKPVIEDVYKFLGLSLNFNKSITFEQFIHYLARTEDYCLDQHWRSQHTFLGLGITTYDFIGQFEKLDLAIKYLSEKFKLEVRTKDIKPKTNYNFLSMNSEKFHEKYPEELKKLNAFPKPYQFYTPDLEELVRVRFSDDISIYEREFNVTCDY